MVSTDMLTSHLKLINCLYTVPSVQGPKHYLLPSMLCMNKLSLTPRGNLDVLHKQGVAI